MASGHRGTSWGRAGRLLTTAALAATLVACGGSDDKDKGGSTSVLQADPVTVVTASADRTTAARNAKVDINGTVAAGDQTINLTGNGAIDFAGRTFQLSLTIPAVGQIEERLVDNIIYIRIPEAASAQFGGKPWLKLDPNAFGPGQNPFGSLESSNPAQVLGTLEGAGQVTKVGDENVRGVHTVHYRAQIDVAKAAEAQGLTPQQRQQLQQALGGQTTVPEDVWIDDQGLVRRIAIEFAAQPPGAAAATPSAAPSSLQTRLTMEFYDYGQATAPVTAPPADQVTDFSQILGQLGQLGGAFGGGISS